MIKKSTNIEYYFVTALIIFSFLLRFVSIYFVRDIQIENEWSVLLNNLINYNSYSLNSFEGQLIPSVFMPPLYPFFLYFIKTISFLKDSNFLYLVFFVQTVLSTYGVYLFYKINKNFFSNQLSLINAFVFSIIPLNIYTCGQISSANIQLFLSLIFLKLMFTLIKNKTQKNIIFFSIVSGLLILCRGEFVIIFVFTLFFIFISKKIDVINLIKILIIVFLVISPYVIRNYIHFNQFIIVKSLGYNLWKGNNELSKVEGYENYEKATFSKLKFKINNIDKDKYYEFRRDKVFLDEALKNLKEDSIYYVKLYFKKIFSFFFIDMNSSYPNYYNIFHFIPALILGVLSFPGFIIALKKRSFNLNIFLFYLCINLLIFSFFFILPRYKLIILPIQIILASYFINYIFSKIKKN